MITVVITISGLEVVRIGDGNIHTILYYSYIVVLKTKPFQNSYEKVIVTYVEGQMALIICPAQSMW